MSDLNFPNAISDERDFFGRADLLLQINQTLRSQKRIPIFVVGERRIGKTSLQNIAIRQLLSEDPSQFCVFSIEPRGITSCSQLIQVILRRLATWAQNAEIEVPLPQSAASLEDLEYTLSILFKHQNQAILICIDEFDEIVRGLGQELSTLLGMFYYLVEKTRLPIYFFFTMTNIPYEMQDEIPSTLISISQILELKPLAFTEMRDMTLHLTHSQLDWTPVSLEELFHLSGGHPYFTKLLISCLLNESLPGNQPVTVTINLLTQAVQHAVHNLQAEHVLKNLYKIHFSPEEKDILLFMAQQKAPLQIDHLEKAGKHWVTQAKHLKSRHYLKMGPDGSSFDYQIAFLGEWLRNWTEFDLQREEFCRLSKILSGPEIEVDKRTGIVRANGKEVPLSIQEYKIMYCLTTKAEQLVTRDDLITAAWNEVSDTSDVTDQMIDNAIYRLRKKLGIQGQNIETKTGQGFILHRAILLNTK